MDVTPGDGSSQVGAKGKVKDLEIRFITSNDDNVPASLPPVDLMKAIDRGRVKFVYRGANVDEAIIIQLIKDGTINTMKNHIKRVDRATFRKSRNGQQDRDSGDRHKKKSYK